MLVVGVYMHYLSNLLRTALSWRKDTDQALMEDNPQSLSATSEPVLAIAEVPKSMSISDDSTSGTAEYNPAIPPSLKSDEQEAPASPSRFSRPKLTSRKSSGTIIIPREADVTTPLRDYPPDDARAMSPRRSSSETEKLGNDARLSVQEYVSVH